VFLVPFGVLVLRRASSGRDLFLVWDKQGVELLGWFVGDLAQKLCS